MPPRPADAPPHDPVSALTYSDYLKLDILLATQEPRMSADERRPATLSEHFFIVAHQACELWLKQAIGDIGAATRALRPRDGESDAELAAELLERVCEVLNVLLGQLVVLERLPVRHFAEFRHSLGTASGAESEQFEELGRLLGDGDGSEVLFHAFKAAIERRGLSLTDVCRLGPGAGVHHRIAESLMSIADRYWRWKITHLSIISKLIGDLPGTGGTSGLAYLAGRVVQPFAELRRERSHLHADLAPSRAG
ncbi:tryptophan 2,3-dioxygenase family protein [Actinokineospora guangxiensis]|uniref:Tryptophan 2,3-dioxygenase family protein n=1 Tax=Actinokineospora guangxiensis TaxID=1490288 RepID=A0ABW0EUR0_9PSEU